MQDQRGVTVLELLITVVIVGLILAGIYNTFQSQEQAFVVQERVAEMNQNARVGLEIISRNIRNAAYDPQLNDPTSAKFGSGAGARIQTANDTTFVFTQDLDADGSINADREWLGYRRDLANKEIDQCMGSANCDTWNTMVDDVENLQFRYIYEDGDSSAGSAGMPSDTDADATNDFEDIREVEIQIVAQRRGGFSEGFQKKTLTSRVQIRNLALR